jgi:hypothetical protein
MKLYTKEKLRASMLSMITYIKVYDESVIDKIVENHIKALGGVELPSDEEIEKHINYLITCRQNLIDNADNMPQHLLEGGCMAFESAIDNARELFLGGNK